MDRYYYDFLVDRKRYGFNVPDWLPRVVANIIPRPDMVIYLDNEAQPLFLRKQELTLEELRRQIHVFRKLAYLLPNAHVIRTDKPLEEVIQASGCSIIGEKSRSLLRTIG